MRFAFLGTPPFAAKILDRLLDAGLTPELVVTQPDALSRRGSELWPSAVAEVAVRAGLPLEKPKSLPSSEYRPKIEAALRELDFVVLAAYGKIIPEYFLSAPRQGWINVHTSMLPRWRGAAPIQRAILAGDEAAGVSIMRMEAGLDTGPYCAQVRVTVGDQDLAQLEDTLAAKGAELLLAELPKIIEGAAVWQEQDETQATYAKKIDKHELDLSPEQTAETNVRRVRASSDSAPARLTLVDGGRETALRALNVELRSCHVSPPLAAGTALAGDDHLGLICASADTYCVVTRLQPAGKRPQATADFLRGQRLTGESLAWR